MTEKTPITRVPLNGDAVVLRVMVDGKCEDRVFVRDTTQARSNNIWIQIPHWKAFNDQYESIYQ